MAPDTKMPAKGGGGVAGGLANAVLALKSGVFAPMGRAWGQFAGGIGFVLTQVIFAVVLALSFGVAVLRRTWRVLDAVILFIEKTIVVVALMVMSLLVFTVALDRWVDAFSLGWTWATKLALFLMIWVGFLGASIATKERKHLAIDIASKVLSPSGSRTAAFFSQLFSAGFCFLLARYGFEYVAETREFGDREAVLPMVPLWLVQLVIPISLVISGLRFVAGIFEDPPATEGSFSAETEDGVEHRARPVIESMGHGAGYGTKDVILAGIVPGALIGSLLFLKLGASVGWLIFLNCFLLLLVGAPLFVVIGAGATASVMLLGNGLTTTLPDDMFTAVKKELLLSIPFFVLAGAIMTAGSISDRLINMANRAIGWLPGGLGISTVVACLLFAAISGSAPVTVIAIGTIMLPALIKERFDEEMSIGLVATAGTLGVLIPPSIPMIIYAIVAGPGGQALSIRELFIAGVIPGLLVAAVLCFYVMIRVDPAKVQPRAFDRGELWVATRRAVWSIGLMGLIFVGIYVGLFTVVEASAVAVLYALVIEFFMHREIKLREAPRVFVDSAVMMGSLFLILVLAISLNLFLTEEQIPQQAAEWISSIVTTKVGFLLVANIFLLILGCLMDIMSAILIVGPLLAPIAMQYGIDPIHFGIIFIVNLSIGYITPPMGLNLFVASTVFEEPVLKVIRSAWPFTIIMLIALALVTYVPAFSLILLDR